MSEIIFFLLLYYSNKLVHVITCVIIAVKLLIHHPHFSHPLNKNAASHVAKKAGRLVKT